MTRGRSGRGTWALFLFLILCLGTAQGVLADAPPPPTRPDGLEAATDGGVGTGFIHPGETAVTQQVTLTDSDADADDITILEVEIDNLGTATAADLALIEILDGVGTVLGQINPGAFPVVIDIVPDFVIADGGAGVVDQTLQVRCTVAGGVVGRRTIQTQLTVRHAEGAVGWVLPYASVINDGNATTINNCPTANDDTADTNEDNPVAGIAVLPNDNDPDGDPLNVTGHTAAGKGAVTQVGNTFTYDPNGQFEALALGEAEDDTFQYTISDNDGGCGVAQRTATVTVTVNGVNDAPVATDDADTTDEDTAIVIDVLANDTDIDNGDVLTVQGINDAGTLGCVTNNGNNVTYDPCGQFEGLKAAAIDTFQYTVQDANGATDVATVTVTVNGLNDPPVVADDDANTDEDTPVDIDVLGNDTDPDDALVVGAVTQGANGTVTNNGNDVTYTPDPDWCGDDTFTYTADDGTNPPVQGTVTVHVACVNDDPVANDDDAVTDEDTAVVIVVLANDTDADTPPALGGDVLTVTGVNTGAPYNTVGVVTLNPDNTITFDPNGQYENLKVSEFPQFEYTVDDGHGATDTAVVTVEVQGINDPPVVVDDNANTDEDNAVVIDVLGNDTDPDDALVVGAVTQGANGTVTNNGNDVTYTPDPNWCGIDTFTYTADDGTNPPVQGTVTVNVACVNDDPVAGDDGPVAVDEDSANNVIDVLANDNDVDVGDVLFVDAIVTAPGNGAVVNNGNNVSYTSDPNYVGNDWFEYRVSDGNGGTDVARVDINVLPTAPRFDDDLEGGVAGWEVTGQWGLEEDPNCCPPPLPSPTHAWVFGNNGFFVGGGLLTTPAIDVTGLGQMDVLFWYCWSITRAYGLVFTVEVSFDGGAWANIWPNGAPPVPNAWTQVAPIRVDIPAGAATANLRFNVASRYGWGCIGIDDIVVAPVGGGGGNRAPTADAGPDQADICTGDLVNLDGTGSFDPDFDALAYNWAFTAMPPGSAAVLNNADTATPSFIPDVAGVYQIQLDVDDGNGGNDADTVNVTAIVCGGAGLFFDDMEAGAGTWAPDAGWQLVNNPGVGTASPTHAWQYANGLYSGTDSLTSPVINVAGQATAIVQFFHYLSINAYGWLGTAGTSARLEVSFDGGAWQEVRRWTDADPQNVWMVGGPINVPVPAGAANMRLQFTFSSRLGRGGWWIDDVQVLGVAGVGPLSVDGNATIGSQDSFRVDSAGNSPNPIRDVHTTTFSVKGIGIEAIMVQIFDLSGRLVFDSGWQPNDYDWHLQSDTGETLANGVYLYVVTARGRYGETAVLETKKLAVYR